MTTAKNHIESNIRRLEEAIEKCDFIRTASAFSTVTCQLKETYFDNTINKDEYRQYMNMTVKMLSDNKCNCTKTK